MKFASEFSSFLIDEVNLNKTRIENLGSKSKAIEEFVYDNWSVPIRGFSHQGSWAHETIIKPQTGKGFDADLLVSVYSMPGMQASDYISSLYDVFRSSGVYSAKTTKNTRCVTVDYAGDFSLDVVPCVVNRNGNGLMEICNSRDNVFELTDGDGFTNWWNSRCAFANGSDLKSVARLFKYLRDIKGTFSVKSVLLTTLIGQQVTMFDKALGSLTDIPSTLKCVADRLDDYIQSQHSVPIVSNPAMPAETFIRHWDEAQYQNFREKFHRYRTWIDEAYDESDEAESLANWRRVFGESFGAGVVTEEARAVSARYMTAISAKSVGGAIRSGSVIAREILEMIPRNPNWAFKSRWKIAPQLTVLVRADLYEKRDGIRLFPLESGQAVAKNRHLLFAAVNSMGLPFSTDDYDVRWQVVNTDPYNERTAPELRGGFYKSDAGHGRRWEVAFYRGVHWVEALVIRKRDQVCVGKSERFFVAVE